ncbi:MAG: fused MFS/spermidine synthase [Sphingomonas sp.]|uniref:fused MFS/spermidine synthase n=1 Tax=Sphingomonas sp. TaxID=28214 RepID=UPI002273CF6B|nr:fused MFS/spermidine synthase [Sphingomonas sp.]MCX8476295.1 fused MFS/spermidine synthase [Sphingomonas sp.]
MAFPFDPPAAPDGSCTSNHLSPGVSWPRVARVQEDTEADRTRRDRAEVNLLLDVVAALDHGRPAIAACLREHEADARDFALVLDAPFGIDGPALLELGDLCALLFDPSMMQSVMRLSDPNRLLLDYTRVMMGFLLLRPMPRRIEMIGLGGGSLAKFCHRYLPDADITVVEIDPRVIALRDRFRIPQDDGRFRVIHADGADFARDDPSRPDVILVDGFDRYGQTERLDRFEFYRDCRDRLGDDGLLVVNLCDNPLARGISKSRLRHAFGDAFAVVPIEGEQNRIVFASRTLGVPDANQLQHAAILNAGHGVDFSKLATRMARRFGKP